MKDISIHEYYANLLENQDTKPYTLMKPPEPVGWWKIGADELGNWGTTLPVYSKPTDKQIHNHYKLLGWSYTEKYL